MYDSYEHESKTPYMFNRKIDMFKLLMFKKWKYYLNLPRLFGVFSITHKFRKSLLGKAV